MLQRVEEGTVVPILGPDLLTVLDGGRERRLYRLVATRLAERLNVSALDAPEGYELEEVARRHQARTGDSLEIYRSLRAVFRDLEPMAIPPVLAKLAAITSLKLYVSTSVDSLMERALDLERFDGQRQTLAFAYSPNDKQDLPPEFDRLNRPSVFYLMGRMSATPHSYAVTREDRHEFMSSLEAKREDAPGFLFDKLRTSHLLVLGSRSAEWIGRLFTDETRSGLQFELDSPLSEVSEASAAGGAAIDDPSSAVLFLERLHGGTKLTRSPGGTELVDELHRRWLERRPAEGPEPPEVTLRLLSSPGIQSGVVFLSCCHCDRQAAEAVRRALDLAGVDVLLDVDDEPLAEHWDKRLSSFLSECSLFVPVLSAGSVAAPRRWLRADWLRALAAASRALPQGAFIRPLVVDGTTPSGKALPEELGELRIESSPGGKLESGLIEEIVSLQRRYRKTRFA